MEEQLPSQACHIYSNTVDYYKSGNFRGVEIFAHFAAQWSDTKIKPREYDVKMRVCVFKLVVREIHLSRLGAKFIFLGWVRKTNRATNFHFYSMWEEEYGKSGHLSIFTSLKQTMVLLRCNFFKASCLYLIIKDTGSSSDY